MADERLEDNVALSLSEEEQALVDLGFERGGPFAVTEVAEEIGRLTHDYPEFKEIRVINGRDVREDMESYPSVYMVYIKKGEGED